MNPTYDWLSIRAMWEAGDSASSIAEKDGMPSKQAICNHANEEGWTKIDKPPPKLDVIPFDGLSQTQRVVVTEMAEGLPQKYAAAIAGVSERTVTLWKAENPAFSNAVQAAIGVMVKSQLGKIAKSDDWRSGLAMIERHPATRDDFAPANAHRGMTGTTFNVLGHVNLGFDRLEERVRQPEPVVIEQ